MSVTPVRVTPVDLDHVNGDNWGAHAMTLYAEQVHARLTIASKESGAPCPQLATIDPDKMQVSLAMSLCRHSGVDYATVFSTRSAAV